MDRNEKNERNIEQEPKKLTLKVEELEERNCPEGTPFWPVMRQAGWGC